MPLVEVSGFPMSSRPSPTALRFALRPFAALPDEKERPWVLAVFASEFPFAASLVLAAVSCAVGSGNGGSPFAAFNKFKGDQDRIQRAAHLSVSRSQLPSPTNVSLL